MKNQRATLFVTASSLISFLLITFQRSSFAAIDLAVNSWSTSIHSDPLTLIALVIHYGFDTIPMFTFSLAIAGYLFYKKCKRCALLLMGAMLFNAAILTLVRTFVNSTRPLNSLIIIQLPSFPSGHVTGAVVFFGLLTYFTWKLWRSPKAKVLSSLSYLTIVLIMGFDRIYLNVHWLSDVLGGYSLGIFLVTLSILISEESGT